MRINYKNRLKLPAAILLLSVIFYCSCKKDNAKQAEPIFKGFKTEAKAANETVDVWETTTDQTKLLAQQTSVNFASRCGHQSNHYHR